MHVRGIVWLGTRTARFEEMAAFAEDVLGLAATHREDGLAVFPFENGDTFEIFDEKHEGGGHPDGVAGGFLVDDAEDAEGQRPRGLRGGQRRGFPVGVLQGA